MSKWVKRTEHFTYRIIIAADHGDELEVVFLGFLSDGSEVRTRVKRVFIEDFLTRQGFVEHTRA